MCSAAAPFDLLLFAAVRFAAVMPAAAGLEAARLGSENFDPAPAPASPLAPAGSGRRATYGTTFGYPAETRSVDAIILPIAIRDQWSSPSTWTQARGGKLPVIFTARRLRFVSEWPVRVAGNEKFALAKLNRTSCGLAAALFHAWLLSRDNTTVKWVPLPPLFFISIRIKGLAGKSSRIRTYMESLQE